MVAVGKGVNKGHNRNLYTYEQSGGDENKYSLTFSVQNMSLSNENATW